MKRPPEQDSSARVGRFGPRSLGFRLLVVMLVPMVGLQLFAYREVRRQSDVRTAAGMVSSQAELLRATAGLIVPLYLEYTASSGLLQADDKGYPRETLTELTGADFTAVRRASAQRLSDRIADARIAAEGVSPSTRDMVQGTLDGLTDELTEPPHRLRHELTRLGRPRGLRYVQLTDRLRDMNDTLSGELRDQATTAELNSLGAEADQLIASLEYASDELAHLTDAGISGDPQTHLVMMLNSGGALDASLTELRELLSPARRLRLNELTAGRGVQRRRGHDAAIHRGGQSCR